MKSRVHLTRRTTSGRMRRLFDHLVSLGFRRFTLRWVPMGPALEMCGHSGGYMLVELPGNEMTPLGLSLADAMRGADSHAGYVSTFHPERLVGATP